mmetsp:Transcript_64062/g.93789  ORF Transcript_64062/g.93789 Transcript_64062/m.93789 type:complete len:96 (+) Transcript_64062:150-437(+)
MARHRRLFQELSQVGFLAANLFDSGGVSPHKQPKGSREIAALVYVFPKIYRVTFCCKLLFSRQKMERAGTVFWILIDELGFHQSRKEKEKKGIFF